MTVKYSEELIRHRARMASGHECELLERRTFEQTLRADGTLDEPREINRRFDLRTGERALPLGAGEFQLEYNGERLSLI